MQGKVKVILLSLFMGMVLYGCSESEPVSETTVAAVEEYKTPEHILAALEKGMEVGNDDPSVSRFRMLLNDISAKCVNDREEISETTIEIQEILEQRGIRISLSELLTRINSNIPEAQAGHRFDFRKIASAFHGLAEPEPAQN